MGLVRPCAETFETKINVAFKPEEGNGAGLSSTVILIVDEKYKTTGGELMNNSSQISFNAIFEDIKKIDLATLGIIATIILLVILLTIRIRKVQSSIIELIDCFVTSFLAMTD